jgi:hypothetical protein
MRTLPVLLDVDIWAGNRIRVLSLFVQALVKPTLLQDEFAVRHEDGRMWREIKLCSFFNFSAILQN